MREQGCGLVLDDVLLLSCIGSRRTIGWSGRGFGGGVVHEIGCEVEKDEEKAAGSYRMATDGTSVQFGGLACAGTWGREGRTESACIVPTGSRWRVHESDCKFGRDVVRECGIVGDEVSRPLQLQTLRSLETIRTDFGKLF